MKKVLRYLFLAILCIASAQVSAQIVQVTNNSTADWKQQISGTKIVWYYFDGSQWDIYQHDIQTGVTTQITNTSAQEDIPQISGDSIVWQAPGIGADMEIWLFDGTSTIQLTNNFDEDNTPYISQGNVVWQGDAGGDYEVYYYDGSSTIPLTNNAVYTSEQKVSGKNVIWTDDSAGFNHVFMYDGSITTQMTFGDSSYFAPQIDGARATWYNSYNQNEIYYFDGSTIKRVTNNINIWEYDPHISGTKVVWWDDNTDAWLYDGATSITTQVSFNGHNIKISGDIIAWLEWDGSDNELMFSNGDTTIQLTDDTYNISGQAVVQIDGDIITWSNSDGNDNEIFYYRIPSATFSVNDTTPCVDDTVQFNNLSTGAQSYEWFVDGVPFSTDTNPNYIFGTNGTYTIMLVSTDTFLTDTSTVLITVNNNPTVTTTFTDVTCNGLTDGTAAAVASGTSGYSYIWVDTLLNFLGTGPTIGSLPPNMYMVGVQDVNLCFAVDTVIISEPDVLLLTGVPTNISCAGGSDGSVNATVTGGTLPYTYLWSGGYTGPDTTNVTAGLYAVTVTDANGCNYNTSFNLTQPTLMGSGYTVVDVLCNGDSTGSINMSISGGVVPYTYSWTNGDTTQDLTQLLAGSYTYTVTDANGCIESDNVTITEPTALAVSISGTDASCSGFNDGSAGATASGGVGPYTYAWSTFAVTPSISSLSAGTYSLTVTDNNNCVNIDSVIIGEAQSLSITLTSSNVLCNGACDGMANVSVTGGTQPYSYSWSTNPIQADSTATGLCPGVYNVDVTDAQGCQLTPNATITEPAILTVATSATNSTCLNTDGTVTGIASGGTQPYTYTWSGGATTNLGAGTYTVSVVDSNGCTVNGGATVIEIADVAPLCIVTVDSTSTHNLVVWDKPSVSNIDSFRIFRYILGTYTWIGSNSYGAITEFVDTTNGINPNVTSYRYVLTSLDVCGNESDTSAHHETVHLTVNQGIPPVMNLIWDNYEGFGFTYYYIMRDSTMLDNWEIIDSVTNISFTYSDLTPPQTGALRYRIDVVPPSVCVATKSKDYNASKSNTSTSVGAVLSVSTSSTIANDPICDGTASVVVSGGFTPYTYLWDDSLAQTTVTATNLCSGDYTVLVTDATGDTISANVTVSGTSVALGLTATATNANSPACDGTATAVATGGVPPYTYLWDDPGAQTNTTAAGLCAGDYTVLVTDANGDTISTNVNVASGPSALGVNVTSTAANSPTCDGTAIAIPNGGTSPYTYLWDDPSNQTTQVITNLCAGDYTVLVTDALGDTVSGTVNVPDGSVGINDADVTVTGFKAAPNPFDVATEISYAVHNTAKVELIIYNALGEIVVSMVNEVQSPGDYSYQFASRTLGFPPGIYLANLRVGTASYSLRIVEL